jgi:hypothetical protein
MRVRPLPLAARPNMGYLNAPDRWVLMKSCLGAGWRFVLGISLFARLAAIYAAADWRLAATAACAEDVPSSVRERSLT